MTILIRYRDGSSEVTDTGKIVFSDMHPVPLSALGEGRRVINTKAVESIERCEREADGK